MDELAFDPYVLGALVLFLASAGGLGLLLTGARLAGRSGAWGRLAAALTRAKEMGGATFAPLAGGRHGEFLILAKGKHAERLPGQSELAPITRAALVKDKDGQTGLVIEAGGVTSCVTGLEPMTRAWAQLQKDDVPVQIVFRDDEPQRVARRLAGLHQKEQELVQQWLTPGEVLTDVVSGVDYEGQVSSPGSKAQATLLVTPIRVGLLARTVQVERVGNMTRTTTGLNLITYLLPQATQVTMERTASLSRPEWRLRLALPEGAAREGAPVLKLNPDHTGLFLPLVVFKRPVQVVDAGGGLGRVLVETIAPACGCGILLGGLFMLAALINYGNSHTYEGRYILPAALAGLITPGLFKALSLVEAWFERSRAQALTPS